MNPQNAIKQPTAQQNLLKPSLTFIAAIALSILSTVSLAQNMKGNPMNEATMITLKAAAGQESELANFLTAGADLVAQTEPLTLLWAALKNDEEMVIFDTFADNSGREAHFAGQVAAALNENSDTLVAGGWDEGVVANINNATILSGKTSSNASDMQIAVFIPVTAKEGQEGAVAEFLAGGAAIIEETEPLTSYWYALQFSETEFAIIDFFAEQAGVDAHFAGQVAAALKENADALLVGGWDDGVVANIHQYEVLALISR